MGIQLIEFCGGEITEKNGLASAAMQSMIEMSLDDKGMGNTTYGSAKCWFCWYIPFFKILYRYMH